MTDIRPLTEDTLVPLADLAVAPDQEALVAPNVYTMAQALFVPAAEISGLWDGATPVGLLAVIDLAHPRAKLDPGARPDSVYIWRMMEAAEHQRRGHGRAALSHAVGLARARGRRQVTLGVSDRPETAMAFYEGMGFVRTGRVADGEVEMTHSLT